MKHFLLILAVSLFIVRCQKDLQPNVADYFEGAKKSLKDGLSITDFTTLDFSNATLSRVDSIGFFALYVPFKSKAPK